MASPQSTFRASGGCTGLAFHNGAYNRRDLQGIDPVGGSRPEWSRAFPRMSMSLTMRRIILPQAFKRALPPLGNQFIIAVKDSSLASFIGMYELFSVATTLGSNNFDYMTYLLVVAIYYLVHVFVFTIIVNNIEKRLSVSD